MKTKVILAALVLRLLITAPLTAQETAAERHVMATNHLKRVAAEISARCLREIHSLADWQQQQPALRRQLLEMLGLEPLPKRTPLQAQITGRLDRDNYRIEKIVFQSLPGLYVTGNFYVPKDPPRPLPTILYLCGHSPHPLGAKFNYQNRAAWFARHGYACLILDTHEFGEVAGIHHGTHDLNMWYWLSLGYNPAGVEVWNAIRALDYLETRPEVDAQRIGLTGISGGGAITWYTAALDERVATAAPVCSTYTFGSQADHWVAAGQCDCIYYHNTYQWDFPIVAALIAPRPLLIISGQKDTIFPPDGYHAVFQRARRVYDLYAAGHSDRIDELDDEVGHSDPPLFLRAARQWMQRWLKDDPTPLPLETNSLPGETAEDLACLDRLPADAINYRIQNQFVPAATLKLPASRAAWAERRNELVAQLKEKVFGWFPPVPVPFTTAKSRNSGGWTSRYADYQEVSFQTEAGVRVRAQLLTPKSSTKEAPLLIYVKRAADSFYFMDLDELLPLLGRYAVLILNPRFGESSISAPEYANIERTAVWTGRTVASLQIWDILRAIEWAVTEEKLCPDSISLYGKGEMAVLTLYAALLDPGVGQVILQDPPSSHWQGPALLNVLRITDVPEVAGALAPRRLVLLTRTPDSFSHTRAIYQLHGAAEQFSHSGSLPEALQIWRIPWRNPTP